MPDAVNTLFNFVSTASVAIVAGLLSYAAGKGMKRHEWLLNIRREKATIRHRLYADFLAEADHQILLSLNKKSSEAASFLDITRKFSEIELLSSDSVCEAAKAICSYVIGAHSVDTKKDVNFYDLKQVFVREARNEIAEYER